MIWWTPIANTKRYGFNIYPWCEPIGIGNLLLMSFFVHFLVTTLSYYGSIFAFLSFFFFFPATCFDFSAVNSAHMHCSQVPQISLFSNFFIKNGFYSTIHTFKNYFATVFSVFSIQFQQNKFYPNGPLVNLIYIKVTLFFP